MSKELTQNKKKSKIPKGVKTTNKNSINFQIQLRIGRSIAIIFIIIAVLSILIVRGIVTSANNTELTLESKAASYQLADYFDGYSVMVNQMTANPYMQKFMDETSNIDDFYNKIYGIDTSVENTEISLEDENVSEDGTDASLENENVQEDGTDTSLENQNALAEDTNVSAVSSTVSYETILTN